jgi:hypothetical protein
MAPTHVDATFEQVRLALQARGFEYVVDADDRLTIDYGSARISTVVKAVGDSAVVRVDACVLDGVRPDVVDELHVLRSLNERNRAAPYGKFSYDAERSEIVVEYELLGDHLQDPEFLNALTTVAQLADDHDDLLQRELGIGRRAADRGGAAPASAGG